MSIKENTDSILRRVSAAASKVGRNPQGITVIAVTKTVGVGKAIEVVKSGLVNLGENRVQEFVNKYEAMADGDIKWHMIGHLQSNKVKYIIDKVHLIHSVESLDLAEEIDKRAKQHNLKCQILIELNIGEEDSKFGINKDNVYDFIKSLGKFENISIVGLMTVAPYCEHPEDVRWIFKEMKFIYDKLLQQHYENVNMQYLSMGMTNDFEIAIEEGSNIVRIGTAIFGERKY